MYISDIKDMESTIVAQNECMTISKFVSNGFIYTRLDIDDKEYAYRNTKTKGAKYVDEHKSYKYNSFYMIDYKDDFILELKRKFGKFTKTTFNYGYWEYDDKCVNEYISELLPIGMNDYIQSSRYLIRLHGHVDEVQSYDTHSPIFYKKSELEEVTKKSASERRQERNINTMQLIETIFQANIESINQKHNTYLYRTGKERSICMGVRNKNSSLNEMVKKFVEEKIISELNEIGLTGDFNGEVVFNGNMIENIRLLEE